MLPGVTAKLKNLSNCKNFFTQIYAGTFEHVVRDPAIRETDTGESLTIFPHWSQYVSHIVTLSGVF
jgi:hypothetical protein